MREKITKPFESLETIETPVYGMKIPISDGTGRAEVIEYGDLLKRIVDNTKTRKSGTLKIVVTGGSSMSNRVLTVLLGRSDTREYQVGSGTIIIPIPLDQSYHVTFPDVAGYHKPNDIIGVIKKLDTIEISAEYINLNDYEPEPDSEILVIRLYLWSGASAWGAKPELATNGTFGIRIGEDTAEYTAETGQWTGEIPGGTAYAIVPAGNYNGSAVISSEEIECTAERTRRLVIINYRNY